MSAREWTITVENPPTLEEAQALVGEALPYICMMLEIEARHALEARLHPDGPELTEPPEPQ